MFRIDDDKTIHLTRGDIASMEFMSPIESEDEEYDEEYEPEYHVFQSGDVIRFKVVEKNNYGKVVLTKDVKVTGETTVVDIYLDKDDTKIGEIINKPKEYNYEVEVNPDTAPQTPIGHDDEGAKVLILYPEGA